MLSNYKAAQEVAKETDKKLTAYNFTPSDLVIVMHEEGSTLIFKSAFLREWKDYVFIFTEHHGFHIYHRGDLSSWGQYQQKEDEKLKDTLYKDICEFCNQEAKVEDLIYDLHPDFDEHDHQYHTYCKNCRDVERCFHKKLWKNLNSNSNKPWGFIWGVDNIENIKKACATVMKEDYVDTWLDTSSPAFPNTPRKVFEDGQGEDIYIFVYQMGTNDICA